MNLSEAFKGPEMAWRIEETHGIQLSIMAP